MQNSVQTQDNRSNASALIGLSAKQERTGRINRLKRLAEVGFALTGDPIEVFRRSASIIGELLDVPVVNVSEIRGDELVFLSTYIKGDVTLHAGSSKLQDTPCAMVQESRELRVFHDVLSKFPKVDFLREFNAYSYCGFPILNDAWQVVAVVCLLDEKLHEFSEEDKYVLNILAQRIGMEFERQKQFDEHARKDAELAKAVQRAEEEKAKSEAIIAAIGDGISIQDRDFKVVYQNDILKKRLGDHIGKQCYQAYEKNAEQCAKCPLVRVFSDGGIHTVERSVQTPHGTVYLETTASPLRNAAGDIIAGIEVIRDITERRLTRDQLAQTMRDWEDTFNTLTDMVTVHDREFNIIRANKSAERILELPSLDLNASAVKCFTHYHGTACPPEECASCKSLVTGMPTSVEVFEPHLNKFIEIRAIPRYDSDKNMVGLIHVVRDISKRKEAEQALKESEEKFRTLFDESKDVFYISTPQGRFMDINPAGVELFGYASREELLSIDIGRSLYLDQAERKRCIDYVNTHEDTKDYPVRMKRKDGQPLSVLISSTPLRNSASETILFRGVIRDITGQKMLEEQLVQSQKMEAVGQLAGGIAHDFNNILTAIIGYGNILKLKMDGADPLRGHVKQILASADRAADLTKSLLAFSRKQIIDPRPLRLDDVVARAEGLITRLIGEDISVRIASSCADAIVMADAGQLEQVLMNLATNARDVMPAGGSLIIETGVEDLDETFCARHPYVKPGAHAVLAVSDSGSGMDETTKNRIFEPFFTTKAAGRGTGLGLSIVYGIVKQHRGYIHVYSEAGIGTTFKIYLPLAAAMVERPGAAEASLPIEGGNETIMVAEDDRVVRELTSSVLRSFGYRVIEATDGQDAVEKFRAAQGSINLVITDMVMPKKNGREAVEQMQQTCPGVKALFMSGYTPEAIQHGMVLHGNQNFLTKPHAPERLLRTVRSILDRCESTVNRAGQDGLQTS